ncbi:MAG: hypothetical protein ABI388_00385 [Bacteroidia bacterium]
MRFFIVSLIVVLMLRPVTSYSQYQLIHFSSSTMYSQAYTNSPGATSHFFYYTYGEGGTMLKIDKRAKNLAAQIKIAPDALKHINKYNKYRRRAKLANATQIFSAIILVPGVVGCGYGIGDDTKHYGIAVAGAVMALAGLAGYIYFENRTDALHEKARQQLIEAIDIYNKYITDNKLTFEN